MANAETQDVENQNLSNDEEGGVPVCDVCFAPKFISDVMTTIDSCQHKFCGYCLDQWAKQHDTCPVDRQKFTKIVFTNAVTGEIIDKQVIKPHNSVAEPDIDNETNYFNFFADLHNQIINHRANHHNGDNNSDISDEMAHHESGDYSELENEYDDEDEDEDDEVIDEQDELE